MSRRSMKSDHIPVRRLCPVYGNPNETIHWHGNDTTIVEETLDIYHRDGFHTISTEADINRIVELQLKVGRIQVFARRGQNVTCLQ